MARTTGNAKDLITFTRASTGTFLGSNGLLQTAAINTPRVEYDANGVAKGLLIEEARTNLLTYSDTSVSWTQTLDITKTSNYGVGPDGSVSSIRIQKPSDSGTSSYFNTGLAIPGGTASKIFTVSCWVKGTGKVQLKNTHAGVVDNFSSDIDATSDWTRHTFTVTNSSAAGNGNQYAGLAWNSLDSRNSVVDIEVFGFQLEEGSFATSYIPTSGATATRSADLASVSVSEFGYNQAQGSVVVEFSSKDNDPSPFSISDGTAANRMLSYVNSSNIRWYILNGNASQANVASSVSYNTDTNYKAASVYAANDFAISVNGELPQIDSAGSVPTSVSLMNIGTSNSGGGPVNGHIKSINYYPLRLSDAKLQELTS